VEGDFVLFVRVDPSTGVAGDVFARVEPDGGWTRLDWSLAPDGSRIAVVRENLWLRTHPVGPGEWSPIPLPEGVVPQRVGLGPDDAVWVTAMVERPDGGNDGFRLLGSTPDGGWSTPYSTTNLWIANPEPSPDGRYVAFDSTGFDTDLWSVAW
jgi:dipeptidyl aminopeptidase/acylaminoacyl peptidase